MIFFKVSPLKVLLFTDLKVSPRDLFWHRDLGLLTKAFRQLGHDAWLVVHPATEPTCNPNPATRNQPVVWASPAEVHSAEWWQARKPDLIILGLWTRPKYDPIRRAALAATPRVIERADSDGMRTASCGLKIYARRRYDYFRDRTLRLPAFLGIPGAALYSSLCILLTPWIESRLAKTLQLLPAVAVETPRAAQLWKALAKRLGGDPGRVYCIPHPVQTRIFKSPRSIPKKRRIISVGRWESYQKNLPLLLRTLKAFLEKQPGWSAQVVGSGLPVCSPHPRICFFKPLPPEVLARKMQASKIFLSTSRYESFGLAAKEAEICRCRVVGFDSFASRMLPFRLQSAQLVAQMMKMAKAGHPSSSQLRERQCSPETVARSFLDIFKAKKDRPAF